MDDTLTSSTPRPVLSALLLLASPAFLASLVACPGAARADAPPDSWTREAPAPEAPDPDPHAPLDDRALAAWDHFEFSMGFMGGLRRFDRMAFRGDAGVDPSLWRQAPFDGVQAYGLRYDVRLVVAYTRMTVGVDFPFTQYAVDETARTAPDGSQSRVAALKPFAFRFGIGGELPVGPVAPFVDVLGSIHSVRAGVRLHVRKWFFAAIAGEIGVVGPMVWAADLSVGFAVM